jgi:peptide-methionine (S)-S-oxide reductase
LLQNGNNPKAWSVVTSMKLMLLSTLGIGILGSVAVISSAVQTQSSLVQKALVKRNVGNNPGNIRSGWPAQPKPGNELLMISGGCFWGIEDFMREQPGVVATAVGYAGGSKANPTYEQVCYTRTGHAESVLVEFDPRKTSYKKLLSEFWHWIDPTVMNRQGPDIGDQYRTAIWTFDKRQREIAVASRAEEQKNWKATIVTTIAAAPRFWMAEEYHQQYDEKTGKRSCAPRTGLPMKTSG